MEPLLATGSDDPKSSKQTGATGLGPVPRRDPPVGAITKTTITPAPGSEPIDEAVDEPKRSLRDRFRRLPVAHGRLAEPRPPLPGSNVLRVVMTLMLSALCLLTVGGAILMLLLWQQQRASGVLSSQLDRTWDLFDLLRQIERLIAFALVPVAVAWTALSAINVHRATGRRRDPIFAGGSLAVGLAGVWIMGDQIVGPADDALGQAAGFVLQAVFLALPLLALERVAAVAEARHGPLRATFVISVVFLAHLQFLAGLSTADQTAGSDEWGRLGAYLVICALLQVLGSLSANEAARAIEDGTQHRYELRHRFGESLLAQAARS